MKKIRKVVCYSTTQVLFSMKVFRETALPSTGQTMKIPFKQMECIFENPEGLAKML